MELRGKRVSICSNKSKRCAVCFGDVRDDFEQKIRMTAILCLSINSLCDLLMVFLFSRNHSSRRGAYAPLLTMRFAGTARERSASFRLVYRAHVCCDNAPTLGESAPSLHLTADPTRLVGTISQGRGHGEIA